MGSLFGGLQRQAMALPPIQPQQAPARGRGLFGGGRPQANAIGLMERIAMMGETLGGGASMADQTRSRQERLRSEQQLAITRQNEDRLRAQLSPADGPMGSGTGAAPDITQQMAALDDARLRDPAVAEQFAPIVQQRRMAGMMAGRPIEEQLAVELNGDKAGESYASQFADQSLAAGTVRSRGGQIVAGSPVVQRFDDRYGILDPTNPSAGATYTAPRGPTFAEETSRLTAERPQIATLGAGAEAFGVGAQGQVTALAANSTPAPPNPAQLELQSSYDTNQREVIPTLNQMRASLASGDVITGLGADIQLQAQRALAAAGNQDAQRRVAATEAYRNMSGRLRVGMAKTLGANPSNADIALLEQITAGNIGQNAESLLATIDQGLQFANRRNTDLQAQMGGQGGQPQGQPQGEGQAPDRAALLAEARRRGLIQ